MLCEPFCSYKLTQMLAAICCANNNKTGIHVYMCTQTVEGTQNNAGRTAYTQWTKNAKYLEGKHWQNGEKWQMGQIILKRAQNGRDLKRDGQHSNMFLQCPIHSKIFWSDIWVGRRGDG